MLRRRIISKALYPIRTLASGTGHGKTLPVTFNTVNDMFNLAALVYSIPIGRKYGKVLTDEQAKQDQESIISKINKAAQEDPKTLCSAASKRSYYEDTYGIRYDELSADKQDIIDNIRDSAGKLVKFIVDYELGMQVGITYSEKFNRICVAFRGSDDILDWMSNIQAVKRQDLDDKDIYLHGGFKRILDNNSATIFSAIDELITMYQSPDKPLDIFVTGHSLGGGLSTIFGYQASLRYMVHQVTVVSFASPRTGNSVFREKHDARPNLAHYRVTNNRDIITACGLIGYKHVGIPLHLTDAGLVSYRHYDSYSLLQWSLFKCWRVSDHLIGSYWKRMSKARVVTNVGDFNAWLAE